MDFAKKQMQKYGWEEGKECIGYVVFLTCFFNTQSMFVIVGKGLGKNEDGIAKAVKPKLKFDNAGIGHNLSADFTDRWWERLYDKAADNVQVDYNTNKQPTK